MSVNFKTKTVNVVKSVHYLYMYVYNVKEIIKSNYNKNFIVPSIQVLCVLTMSLCLTCCSKLLVNLNDECCHPL